MCEVLVRHRGEKSPRFLKRIQPGAGNYAEDAQERTGQYRVSEGAFARQLCREPTTSHERTAGRGQGSFGASFPKGASYAGIRIR